MKVRKNFKLRVDKEIYTECPISYFHKTEIDGYDVLGLFNDAMEAYSIRDSGFLPEEGAWGSQTDFFTTCAIKVNGAIKKYEADSIKAISNKKGK